VVREYVDAIVTAIVLVTMAALVTPGVPVPLLRWFSKHGNSVR
jgi:hypothetical protein